MAGSRALLLLLIVAGLHSAQSQLVIEEAQRKIDIASFRAVHQTKLVVRNDGSSGADAVLLCEASGLLNNAAFVEASVDGTKLAWIAPSSPSGAPAGMACRAFKLPQPLAPEARVTLHSQAVFTHVLRPEPAKIKQNEPQRVVYEDSATLASPYIVQKQSTEITVGTSSVSSFTDVPPSKQSGDSIKYGPYEAIPPLTLKPIAVHYENSAPFSHVPELEREIEVSHWGNVYFEERYTLRHAGARITGEWSRFDLMTRPNEYARASIPMVVATLPSTAHSLYYRDAIGNISSSDTRVGKQGLEVRLQPRYPLFGGWSVQFLFGWSLPLQDCVRKEPSGRMLFAAPIAPSIHGLVVDRLTVKLVLPEGASDIKVVSALPLEGEPVIETQYTYLDVMGRPVVVLRASNMVDELNLPFTVEYSYSSLGLLQKPLLLVAAFGALFAAAIVLNRSGTAPKGSGSAAGKAHAS